MKLENNWPQKSLENLEKRDLGCPRDENSRLVNRVLQLRKIPLNQFTIEDIRLMIGQNEGLIYLITLAINELKADLLAEGDFYPGDLLKYVVNVNPLFWRGNNELWLEISDLIKDKTNLIAEHKISTEAFCNALI